MSYLHCHKCSWSQDDYWDNKTYNPLRNLLFWEKTLLSDKLDDKIENDESAYERTWRNVVLEELEKAGKQISSMKYRTKKEALEKNPDLLCPRCKAKLDED